MRKWDFIAAGFLINEAKSNFETNNLGNKMDSNTSTFTDPEKRYQKTSDSYEKHPKQLENSSIGWLPFTHLALK